MASTNGQNPSGFSVTEVKCPACGAPLQLTDGATTLTCSYCGAVSHVSYGERRETGIEDDGTIRDKGTGYGLFRVRVPSGWRVLGASLQRRRTVSHPYIPKVSLVGSDGGQINLGLGDAGTRNGAGMKVLMATYGSALAHVDRINYAEVPDPIQIADSEAASFVDLPGISDFRFETHYSSNSLETRRQEALSYFKMLAEGQGLPIADPFAAEVLRTYTFKRNGEPWKMASYVRLYAVKQGVGLGSGLADGLGGIFGGASASGFGDSIAEGLGGLFGTRRASQQTSAQQAPGQQAAGQPQAQQSPSQQSTLGQVGDFLMGGGLIGKMRRDREAARQSQYGQGQRQWGQQPTHSQQATPAASQQATPAASQQVAQPQQQGVKWCTTDFAEYTRGGTIFWSVEGIAILASCAEDFDAKFREAFMPFVSTYMLHEDVLTLALNDAAQHDAQVQGAANTWIQQNNARTQAHLQMMRQQQAAFDSYNESWRRNSDAHHQAFRERTNSQFSGSYGGRSAPDYSEAIRGVNTFTTSDGREVELSVSSDRAWENQAGDVIGGSGGFDPGADWTEIPRT